MNQLPIIITTLIGIAGILIESKFFTTAGNLSGWGWWFIVALLLVCGFTIYKDTTDAEQSANRHEQIIAKQDASTSAIKDQLTGGAAYSYIKIFPEWFSNPKFTPFGIQWRFTLVMWNKFQLPVYGIGGYIEDISSGTGQKYPFAMGDLYPAAEASTKQRGTMSPNNSNIIYQLTIDSATTEVFLEAHWVQRNDELVQQIILKKLIGVAMAPEWVTGYRVWSRKQQKIVEEQLDPKYDNGRANVEFDWKVFKPIGIL